MLLILVIPAMAQKSASMRINLEKNKVYRLKSVTEQTITQTINGNTQTVDTKVNHVLSLKMIDQTPDFMVAEARFDTLVTNTNSMGKVTRINSATDGDIASADAGDIMSCIMNRLSKNAMYVKIDFTGRPFEIINAAMLKDLILKDTSSITLKGPMGNALKSQIAAAVSEDGLKAMISSFTWILPGKDVNVGESWKVIQNTNSGGMTLDVVTTYKLESLKNNQAVVTAESVIKPSDNAKPIQQGGATVTYDNLQGLSKASMIIDSTTGLVVSDNAKSHVSGNLGISAPGFSMQMPMDINGETSITSLQ